MTGTEGNPENPALGGSVPRAPTGINGFDQIALGGLPEGRSTLVAGSTGSGKTLFAIEFLARGVRDQGAPGVFVTFEEDPDDIRTNVASLGFPIAEWERAGKWVFIDASVGIADEAPTIGSYDLGALAARIAHAVRRIGARRVTLDSIGAILANFTSAGVVRHELYRIVSALDALDVTTVVTAERHAEYNSVSQFGVEEFVLDNVVILRNVLRQERRRRTVEVVKFRGTTHRTGEWLFTIGPREGIVIMPLAFLQSRERASTERVSSGIDGLDAMCGGGFFRDSIVLLTGPTGTGKTLTSLFFAAGAFHAGERCLLQSFDETRDQLARNAVGWGLDLDAMEASGLLRVVCEYPEVASPEEHFLRVRRAIEEFRPSRVCIDTLSALERIVSSRALLDFVVSLGAVLRHHEVTTLLTSAPTGRVTPTVTPAVAMEVAGLTDVTILLRHVEAHGEMQRAIAVLQTRGSAHDDGIRRYEIDGSGMHIGEPMRGPSHSHDFGAADPPPGADGAQPPLSNLPNLPNLSAPLNSQTPGTDPDGPDD
ncbi:circadian clock protein KaiC [Streptomyces endophyticus]|uniref:non-specific serine/threonine protein kinase n=1 Tax=Streptomyces endophyticus TaxID=714166 RepID=A0ABU6FJM3_9ACTN|nr:circadian clock protein KaiC [Streptomyces endophyticus]MEB8344245.1 circadian clock protein KaiC [Streptomyces endophyticus]